MTTAISLNQVTVAGLNKALDVMAQLDVPALIYGKPGIGKSEAVAQWAAANGYALLDRRASQMLPEDLGGIPHVAGDDVRRATPDIVAEVFHLRDSASKPVLLFLDELNLASPSVLGALYELVLDRRAGGRKLPDDTRVVAAGNPAGCGADVAELPRPLANRLAIFQFTGPTVDEWLAYALPRGLNPTLGAVIQKSPALLHERWDAESERSPTPRAWMRVSRALDALPPNADRPFVLAVVASLVGDAAAHEVEAMIAASSKLRDPRDIAERGAAVPGHSDLAIAFMQVVGLPRVLRDRRETKQAWTWVRTHHAEMTTPFVKALLSRKDVGQIVDTSDPELAKTMGGMFTAAHNASVKISK